VREREDANRTREAGHLDEIQGVVANMPKSPRNGASLLANAFGVGFIDRLDAALKLRGRWGRWSTLWGRGYSWCRCVTLPGKVFL
jgi:hypothetical protein